MLEIQQSNITKIINEYQNKAENIKANSFARILISGFNGIPRIANDFFRKNHFLNLKDDDAEFIKYIEQKQTELNLRFYTILSFPMIGIAAIILSAIFLSSISLPIAILGIIGGSCLVASLIPLSIAYVKWKEQAVNEINDKFIKSEQGNIFIEHKSLKCNLEIKEGEPINQDDFIAHDNRGLETIIMDFKENSETLIENREHIIYIHGRESSYQKHLPFMIKLFKNQDCRVIAYNNRNISLNTPNAKCFDEMTLDLIMQVSYLLLQGINPEKIHLFGHSLGGQELIHAFNAFKAQEIILGKSVTYCTPQSVQESAVSLLKLDNILGKRASNVVNNLIVKAKWDADMKRQSRTIINTKEIYIINYEFDNIVKSNGLDKTHDHYVQERASPPKPEPDVGIPTQNSISIKPKPDAGLAPEEDKIKFKKIIFTSDSNNLSRKHRPDPSQIKRTKKSKNGEGKAYTAQEYILRKIFKPKISLGF